MSEWQQLSLGSLMEIIGGGTPKTSVSEYWGGDIPWLSVVDFNTGLKFVSSTEKTITQEGLNNSSTKLLNKGDIIISARGTVGVLAILDKPMTFNQSCYGIRSKKGISDTDYLYYLLTDTVRELTQISHGGVFDTITRATFDEIEVPVPPLPEQKAIASVLSSLDDKIDLLHRQNKTLEAMAETLFRQWFIEEAKEDWEEVQLKDLVFVIDNRGKTPPYLEEATDHPIIEVNALTKNGRAIDYSVIRKYVTKETFDTWFRQYLEPLDIVLSTVGSIGSFGMFFGGGGCVAQNIIGLRAQKKISNFFLYQWLVANTDEIKELDIGSVQPSIKVPHLLSLSVKIPMTEKLEKFDTQVEDWVRKILANTKQIQTLEKLRDTLLPKLMSGEVRVQYQTEEVA